MRPGMSTADGSRGHAPGKGGVGVSAVNGADASRS